MRYNNDYRGFHVSHKLIFLLRIFPTYSNLIRSATSEWVRKLIKSCFTLYTKAFLYESSKLTRVALYKQFNNSVVDFLPLWVP